MNLIIKGKLATLNDHDKANRGNKFAGAKLKKDMTELVMWQVKNKPAIISPCTLTFHWYFSGKHDFDNICFAKKYLLDGLVKAGVLPDDNQKWVRGFGGDYFTKVEPGKEMVSIEINSIIDTV